MNASPKLASLTKRATEATELLRLLANTNRLLLLCRIAQSECSVGQMETDLQIQQPALSQQLAELRRAELVKTRRESRSIFYSIADARLLTLLPALCAAMSEPRDLPGDPASTATITEATGISPRHGDTIRFARTG
ncbi:ArsR/SmtB family transcription factor [Paraburkholderia tropica]|uniref:ArsR/SmtB family transcription factor n=1 Tax=Paraburkholderia tropica TaxID=92647 RepID=UPI002AB6D516|nr:metalloregulator ArsR/SmtB family transcription factor [Paraburkholderia tropica]